MFNAQRRVNGIGVIVAAAWAQAVVFVGIGGGRLRWRTGAGLRDLANWTGNCTRTNAVFFTNPTIT